MPVRLLTLQTATPAASLGLTEDEQLVAEVTLNLRKPQANWLLPMIERLLIQVELTVDDLDGFGLVVGPGAFTSLRVGMATVKGMALATGRPIACVSSLQTLAMQAPFTRMPVCTMLDARKKEVYACLYSWEGGRPHPHGEERVISPDLLLDELQEEVLFIGDGAKVYRTLITRRLGARAHFCPANLNHPRAGSAAQLAYAEWCDGRRFSPEQIVPTYIRPSEAELNWRP